MSINQDLCLINKNNELAFQDNSRVLASLRNIQISMFRYPMSISKIPQNTFNLLMRSRQQQQLQLIDQNENPSLCTIQNCMGFLQYQVQNQIYKIIGLLVRKDAILSCVQYQHINFLKQLIGKLQFHPFLKGIQKFKIKQIHFFPEQLVQFEQNIKFTLMVATFNSQINKIQYGYLGYNFLSPQFLNRQIMLFNSNGSKIQLLNPQVNGNLLTYKLKNQIFSGSPILQKMPNQYLLIGFHCLTLHQQSYGFIFTQKLRGYLNLSLKYKAQMIFLNWKMGTVNLVWSDLKYLATINFSNLVTIELNSHKIRNHGVKILIRVSWPCLSSLALRGNLINDQGVLLLSKGYWNSLSTLDLTNNEITNSGAYFLLKGNWKSLFFLSLYKNNLTEHGIKLLLLADWTILRFMQLDHNLLNKDKKTNMHKVYQNKFCCLNRLSF